jgi:ribosomal protein S18 acetylase RimI-like enzyme
VVYGELMIKEKPFDFLGRQLLIRETQEKDLPAITAIINAAYKMWNSIGFDKANETPDSIKPFALKDGHVVCDIEGKIIAAFNMRPIQPSYENGILAVSRAHKTDRSVLDESVITAKELLSFKLIYFYGLCVDPKYSQSGLGKTLFEVREKFAQDNGFQAILFETGRDAKWLVEWYQRLGFTIIGNSNKSICPLPLIMMLKKLT